MKQIEKYISQFIEKQFPSFYKEEGEQFIAFVKAYYEWMEEETQIFEVSSTAGFSVGDSITQIHSETNSVTGTILSVEPDTNRIHVIHTSTEAQGEDFSAPGVLINLTNTEATTNIVREVWSGGVIHHARHLPNYRDIDTTLETFVLQFKEKYLKNIQFDTATNKKLLIKNSLDLYRSKGTERSIDLFFKLVYGTSAEVKYPADQILRLSDGIYERPEYLEVTYSNFNIDYVGKQVIGQFSGAKAFVEKYIRRRVGRGFVNLLYISGRQGEFQNGEMIGININNNPVYEVSKRATLIGSVKRVVIETKGQDFAVGDIVKFVNSNVGIGGFARVESVDAASGIVDFIFIDGGYGYTLNASSIVSEKILRLENITADYDSPNYSRLFEYAVQPVVNVAFSSPSASLVVGENVYRYAANGDVVATGKILDVDNIQNEATISHYSGVFTPSTTYYTDSNVKSFVADTLLDRSIAGKVMGIPQTYTLIVSNTVGTLAVGQNVYQKNDSTVFARGTINSISSTESGLAVVLTNAQGAFKNSKRQSDFYYTVGTGTITTSNTSANVTGTSTQFNNNYIGAVLYQTNATSNVSVGIVASVINSTALTLTSNAAATYTTNNHAYGERYLLTAESNTSIVANIESVSATFGIYEIARYVHTLRYSSANNNEIEYGQELFIYNSSGNTVARGVVITVDHDSGTATGNVTLIPTKGYFSETSTVYTTGNTSQATVVSYSVSNTGGDYVRSYPARIFTPISNTTANITSISFGSGASFGVGSIGETETLFIGTDLINANNEGTTDFDRRVLTVTSSTGFAVGDPVYQEINKIAFNASANLNPSTGFIQLPSANTLFIVGDNLRYAVDAGNTAINGLIAGDYYHVRFANTTGLILSYPYRKTDHINTSNFSTFANNVVSEEGHYLYKTAYGTAYEVATGVVRVKDPVHNFGNTSTNPANTTNAANSNLIKYTSSSTNTSITNISTVVSVVQPVQPFSSELIRTAAYGFRKNPLGDLMDTIYSCLSFDRFEIGVIGSLDQVNPGAQYNSDPYVLAYQPYISAFDRKDFDITIENPTRGYVVGEKVQQTFANLVYYDIKVSTGVFGNTYDEKTSSVNTKDEVNSSDDFIYYASNTITFNASDDVDNDAEFIRITGNVFEANDYVRYWTDTGNTVLTGLSNNSFYFVSYANSSGVKLSSTAGGANINITATANIQSFNSNTAVGALATNFISISSANTYFSNGDRIRYYTSSGNTAITGLSNNTLYYVVSANSSGLALSTTSGGSNVAITAQNPGGTGHFLRYYNADYDGHNIRNYVNQFVDQQKVLYSVPNSNVAITGLTDNTSYYVVGSNTVGFKLESTIGGGAINITANGSVAESHTFRTIPGYLPGDRVYQNTSPVVNATVQSVFTIGSNNFVRVSGNTDAITNNIVLYSYSSPAANGLVSNVSIYQVTSTAKGVVKAGSNTTVLKIKRLTFENTFKEGTSIIGEVSGASADVVSVVEDQTELYPIGLNASIEANVTSADGQVTSLQVIDSGFGYSNSEIVEFVSEDNLRAGTAKLIKDGHGLGKGYYRSSRGFLSEDMYIHDGDYYQEYSYEILSKVSVDRYSDMFKKVMHQAGTKFFGSALVVEEANVALSLSSIATSQEVSFNSSLDVSSADDTIEVDITGVSYQFTGAAINQSEEFISLTDNPYYNSQKLEVGDYVKYTSNTISLYGAIGIGDGVSSISNNSYWYVVAANNLGVKISSTVGGSVLNLNTNSISNTLALHYITKMINPFTNGDVVRYTTAAGNTAVEANVTLTFVTNAINSNTISVSNNVFRIGDVVTYTKNGGSSAIGLTASAEYFIRKANSTSIMLANSIGKPANIYSNSIVETHVLRIQKLANNQSYYVVNTTPLTVKLSLTANGTPINITASGTSEIGHYLTKTVEE